MCYCLDWVFISQLARRCKSRLELHKSRQLACDIAYFRLFQEPTEEARKRYEDALRTLRDISAGKIKLPVADGQDAPSRPDVIRATAQTRLFSRDTLTGL